ncbi:MAG: single-stranded DNA-binding protein [Actinobacteria bacterium]|nr:single-stranded DNA-binding protein [Actinomycetota bacterium]
MNETHVTLTGVVATVPEVKSHNGTRLLSFRFVSTERRFDRATGSWVNGAETWATVTCWRALAVNAEQSVRVKDRIIVKGRLRTDQWTGQDGGRRSDVKITAETLGPDLAWGTATFERSPGTAAAEVEAAVASLEAEVADLPVILGDEAVSRVPALAALPAYDAFPPLDPDEEDDDLDEDEDDEDDEDDEGQAVLDTRELVGAGAR